LSPSSNLVPENSRKRVYGIIRFYLAEFNTSNNMKNISKFILIASAIIVFSTLSVFGQTTCVYVATSGNDVNLCTKSAECKTIAKALSVVDDGGEVIITESGDYDSFLI
jgi:hypothetical protein